MAKKGGVLGTLAVAAATVAIPAVVDIVKKQIENEQEKRKNYITVPSVIGARLNVAQNAIEKVGLLHIPIEATANKKYKNHKTDTVVNVNRRAGSMVAPATNISLYYVTQEVIDKSKKLSIDYENAKAQARKERQRKIENIQTSVKEVVKKIPGSRRNAD